MKTQCPVNFQQPLQQEAHRFGLKKKTYTGRFIMLSVITNIYNKKNKAPTLMELFTVTGKLKKFF
jgi:hypothetical protein